MTVMSSSALVVIGSRALPPHRRDPRHARAARQRLLQSLPAAGRVLGCGDDDPSLQVAYRSAHPASSWQQVTDRDVLANVRGPFDLIVLNKDLDRLDDPGAWLSELRELAHDQTTLALSLAHDPSLAMLQRWVEADLSDVDSSAAAERHRSLASATKLLMDAGWMPTLADAVLEPSRDDAFARQALALAVAAGVPAATAQRQWRTRHAVVHARASFEPSAAARPRRSNFAVVVPTTRDAQLRLNVDASPGLREVDARVISVRRASSPADALARALEHVHEDWVLLCHQDVYFAPSFGHRLAAVLDAVPPAERARTLIGFAGIGVDATTRQYRHAGFVIDRTARFDHAPSDAAVSIDELALVLPRESLLRIDPALGWHLWATDLCLQAVCRERSFARIVRAPLFHNSHTDHQLPAAFHASAAVLAAKYPDFGPIHTLCGVIDHTFLARSRSAAA